MDEAIRLMCKGYSKSNKDDNEDVISQEIGRLQLILNDQCMRYHVQSELHERMYKLFI